MLLFVTFLLVVTFNNYFFRGSLKHTDLQQKGCTLIFFIFYYFFTVEGDGAWRYGVFFRVPSLEMWKEEGGKGLIGFSGNVFFIMERAGG